MLFHKSKEGVLNSSPINKSKWVLWLLVLIVGIFILGYVFLSLKSFTEKVVTNWQEIKFVWDKPGIVRATRIKYASESAKLEEDFNKQESSPQDKLIEEVTKQLQSKP